MASEDANSTAALAEVVSVQLPAPEGWKKKFTPKKGGTPRRNEITFISPTGEEITNKRQLDQYLRAHPGGAPSSEFDWGTGDTPRRSSRLSAKAKATETPEGEKPKKRERKSSGKKGTKDKKDGEDGENEAPEAADNAKESSVAEMKDNEGSIDKIEENANLSEAEGEAEKVSKEKTNENVEDKVDPEKENSEILPKDSEDGENKAHEAARDAATADETKGSEDVEMKNNEGKAENELDKKTNENIDAKTEGHNENESSERANLDSEEKRSENAEKEKPESSEPSMEEAQGGEIKVGDAPTENDSSKENRDKEIPMETQHHVNYDDGKHQPKASPVNC